MKKRIVCGSAAILMTGLTVSVFTTAEPRAERETATPVVAQHTKKNAAAIERGRYLVKIAGCNDCHTPGYAQAGGSLPETQWLVGDSLGYQGPWGTTYPVNLRLLMQSMSEQQWLAIARNPARPPMPWFALRDMTDADLSALYHYVRDLGPAGSAAPAFVEPGKAVKTAVMRFPS